MRRLGLVALPLTLLAVLVSATACGHARVRARVPGYLVAAKDTTTSSHAFVAGGGTITSSTSVIGPYGAYPVSGISVGPEGTVIYGGTPPYVPPGYGTVVPGYGAYTRCSGAVACGASTEVTVESWGTPY